MPRFTEYDYHCEVASPYANYMTLAAAIVERAVEDIGTAQRYMERNIHWREDSDYVTQGKRAWHWLTMPHDGQRGVSFAFLCDAMGVDLDHAQDKLIDGVPGRVIDVLERQIVLKIRKPFTGRRPRNAGSNATKKRSGCDRGRNSRNGRRTKRRPGSAGV